MIQTELVIIGRGPAGIQASIYATRAGVETIVIGKGIGMVENARNIQTLLGFESIDSVELMERGIRQAEKLGVKVITDEVVSVSNDGNQFYVRTPDALYTCLSVLIASGARRNTVRIRNLNALEGYGVSYCAECDGVFYKNKHVGVLGHGNLAAYEARELLNVASNVTVFTDGNEPVGVFDERVIINTESVKAVIGDRKVMGIELESGYQEIDGLFVALNSATSVDFAKKLGLELENNKICVDSNQQTHIPGLFAAGDCTAGVQQIAKAIGDGCTAGMNIAVYIRNRKREIRG